MRKHAPSLAVVLAAVMAVVTWVPGRAPAGELGLVDGLWVMKKVEDRYEGDDVQEDLLLTLEKTSGSKDPDPLTLEVRWLKKDYGKKDGLVVYFVAPVYARGVALNMEILPYLDDERFLYFPTAKAIRKVHAKDQHTNFMGTDFTYYDLSEREPDEENHKLLRIEEFNGATCYVVETTPKEISVDGYSRKIFWVDKDRFTKMRIQYFNRAGKLWKQYDPEGWQQIQGIWTPTKLVMADLLRYHKTTIERRNVRYNQKLDDAFFRPQNIDGIRYAEGKFSILPQEQRPKLKGAGDKGAPAASAGKKP